MADAAHQAAVKSVMLMLRREDYMLAIRDMMKQPDVQRNYGFVIRAQDMLNYAPWIAEALSWRSEDALRVITEAVIAYQQELLTMKEEIDVLSRAKGLAGRKRARVEAAGPGEEEGRVVREEEETYTVKFKVHPRISQLPPTPEFQRQGVSSIRSTDERRFVQVRGTVIRTGAVRMLEWRMQYACRSSKCGHVFYVTADVEHDNLAELPLTCPAPGGKCKGRDFALVDNSVERIDHQEVRIQEYAQALSVGSIPRSISVVLEHDLVEGCKAGDEVMVTGCVARRWTRLALGARCDLEVVLKANHVEVLSSDAPGSVGAALSEEAAADFASFWAYFRGAGRPMAARDVVLRSVCPGACGMATAKLAVALALFGGVGWADGGGSGARARGESHLLLVGDPGTGKSQLLRWAARMHPRAVLTTGVGTTSAGLTCVATQDSGEWVLEAGALVLADRGVCCIDEFSQIREHDRTSIHEAMEQQSISVAKAGIVSRLNTRTTVIAACNPKGSFDPDADLTTNTAVGAPLLSRFDVVLVLLDRADPLRDDRVASFILRAACARPPPPPPPPPTHPHDSAAGAGGSGAGVSALHRVAMMGAAGQEAPETVGVGPGTTTVQPNSDRRVEDVWVSDVAVSAVAHDVRGRPRLPRRPRGHVPVWSSERWRAYLQLARAKIHPQISPAAEEVLTTYYQRQRADEARSEARTTLRLLESLVRLSQAHARLCFRGTVGVEDAVVAVALLEASTHVSGAFGADDYASVASSPLADFPPDPDLAHAALCRRVLRGLRLEHLLDHLARDDHDHDHDDDDDHHHQQQQHHDDGPAGHELSNDDADDPSSNAHQQSAIAGRPSPETMHVARARLAAAQGRMEAGPHVPRGRRFYAESRHLSAVTDTQHYVTSPPQRTPHHHSPPRPAAAAVAAAAAAVPPRSSRDPVSPSDAALVAAAARTPPSSSASPSSRVSSLLAPVPLVPPVPPPPAALAVGHLAPATAASTASALPLSVFRDDDDDPPAGSRQAEPEIVDGDDPPDNPKRRRRGVDDDDASALDFSFSRD